MRIEDAMPQPGSTKRRRRVGRGIAAGQGASCGFGMRGQKSRSGRPTRPGFEGGQIPLYRRLPKLHTFPMPPRREQFTIVNVEDLAEIPAKTRVNLAFLLETGILTTDNGPLKVLGRGDLAVGLAVEAAAFTAGAQAKIEAAGGTCTVTEA
jgi:large subunit ribosomal protein L15